MQIQIHTTFHIGIKWKILKPTNLFGTFQTIVLFQTECWLHDEDILELDVNTNVADDCYRAMYCTLLHSTVLHYCRCASRTAASPSSG